MEERIDELLEELLATEEKNGVMNITQLTVWEVLMYLKEGDVKPVFK
ncbi:Uncharacterised protein [Sphingobacterium spiritivorum]|uniref:Uncharacterized protein n=1 Tax=Sphingobacterium spiritivorum TaxID=258 RepID=A0A380CQ51_SPHSI|nr:hypothetical protein [Sphingobacterium spiritivorum]SUJ26385.1 Uncharacterised protein [Sphingobacterium spiritivorum]